MGVIAEEEAERSHEAEVVGSVKKAVRSRPSRSVAYMNSERLRKHIQDQGRLKSDQVPTWKGEAGTKSHT